MNQEIMLLTSTAALLGFIHTMLGPDHYIPFIAMSKARKWSTLKTICITVMCGAGHVLSSVILGAIGIGLGIAVSRLELVESTRGEIAGWLLIAFGLVYLMWGLKRAYKNKPHSHIHTHEDGTLLSHEHTHYNKHSHIHDKEKKNITPWILFTIFIFGPCETLIPILMYPAATESTMVLVIVTVVFGITTVGTMVSIVIVSLYGLKFVTHTKRQKYIHAIAGALIFFCGVATKFLGL